ncbi:MAG: protein kinase [Gemmatimonadales bacterium]
MTSPAERLSAALADRYRIQRELGQGGMATVYLADDLRHDRKVALKVLKPELAAVLGAERFVVEIKTTAALQHPHILPLFDSGTAAGFLFYVMPFIDGETLRARLDRQTQLGVEEAVRITTDVADALQYAHDHGVIHRDIKPENILLQNGRPMVADFGIALAVSAAAGGRMTETGLSLGTPHYMSPEQATADKELTPRSDVYSLGSVLYEMLTGNPPHTGASAQQIIMKIVTEEAAPVTQVRKSVPPHVAAAVARAVERLPADRFESAAAFAAALHDTGYGQRAGVGPSAGQRQASMRLGLVVAGVAAALLVGFGLGRLTNAPATAPVTRVVSTLLPPDGEDFSDRRSFGALSPDGKRFAFVGISEQGERRLWIRRLDALQAELVPGTSGASSPFWSPDGTSIGFFAGGRLLRLDLASATATVLCEARSGIGGAWGEGDVIVVATGRGIERAVPGTGRCDLVVPVDSGARFESPSVLGDGRTVLFQRLRILTADANPSFRWRATLLLGDLETGTTTEIQNGGFSPTFVPPNRVLYVLPSGAESPVVVQTLSRDRSRLEGTPVAVAGSARNTDLQFSYSASANGSLIYLPTRGDPEKLLVDRRGGIIDTIRQADSWTHRVARRHRWVAMAAAYDLWLYDLARSASTPLVRGDSGLFVADPIWSPDDAALAFGRCRWARLDELPARLSGVQDDRCYRVVDWTPDGRFLIVELTTADAATVQLIEASTRTLAAYDLSAERLIPLFEVAGLKSHAAVSPDGRWIAYTSAETGTPEIYLRPFMASGRAVRLSTGGGREARWRSDGRELYYQAADGRIMVMTVPASGNVSGATPRLLFRAPGYSRTMFFDRGTAYDMTPDAEQFVLRVSAVENEAVLVQNWLTAAAER